MEIYLVRHGQTDGNVARRHQEETTKLTDLGVEQAQEAAESIKQVDPTHLISSSLIRAIQTSQIVSKATGLDMETSHEFIELVRPVGIYGHYHRSMKSVVYYLQWYIRGLGGNGDGAGESYRSLRERIGRAQEQLTSYPDDSRIVVVSHAVFITFFIAHLCNKRGVGPLRGLKLFYKMLIIPNGAIIKIAFNPQCEDGKCAWSVDS